MKYLLLILCALELLLTTYLQNVAGPYLSPVLLLASSVGIAVVFMRLALAPDKQADSTTPAAIVPICQLALFCALSYLIFKMLKTIWWWDVTQHNATAISDIIPIVTTMVQRFLTHQDPYALIHFKTYDLFPTYLPLQWMPYILAELAHKDYRWIPAIALWLASLHHFLRSIKLNNEHLPMLLKILTPLWPLIAWYVVIMHYNPMFQFTVEGLVAAYYLFTANAITSRRTTLLISGIALCLLSRYSIVLWVPLCVAGFFLSGKRREALMITLGVFAFFLIFYWLPFLQKDPSIFMKGYHYYTNAAAPLWQTDLLLHNYGFYLYNGLGFTAWALQLIPGDLQHVVTIYGNLNLVLCSASIIGMLVWYWSKRKTLPLKTFLLFSFKVYLAIFYSFIIVPFNYLYLTPVVLSAALLLAAYSHQRRTGI